MKLWRIILTRGSGFADLIVYAPDAGEAKRRVVSELDIPGFTLVVHELGEPPIVQVGGNVIVVGKATT